MLEEWAAEKRILREDIYEGLSIEQEELLLSEIAYKGIVTDQLFFFKKDLSSQIRMFLSGNLNAPKYLDSEAVLDAIEVQQGILVERAEDMYSFSHLTLQEYLAAQYLVDNNEWPSLISAHLTDERWREIFLLLPGLITSKSGSNTLLLTVESKAKVYLQNEKLRQLLSWAELSTQDSNSSSKDAVKRLTAVLLALAFIAGRIHARDFTKTSSTVSIDLALSHARSLYEALDSRQASEHKKVFDRTTSLDRALALANKRSSSLVRVC